MMKPSFLKGWRDNCEKLKAAGEAPLLIGYLTMAMKITPNLERACNFAGEQLGGRMGQDLRRRLSACHLRLHSGADEALQGFAQHWEKKLPELGRSIYLIRSSLNERRASRERTLDRSLQLVLQGARARMREFSSSINLPTLLIYSLGVLLPLVLVVILPVLSVMELQIGPVPMVLLYCVLLPLLVYFLSSSVLSRRPASFPLPGVKARVNWFRSIFAAAFTSVLIPVACLWLGAPSEIMVLAVLWGLVLGISLSLHLSFRGAFRRREEIIQMEEEFSEALVQLGNRVSEGHPAEEALRHVAVTMAGSKLAEIFRAAASNISLGGMGLRAALFEENRGAMREVGSGMIQGTLKMLVDLIERSTRAAGEAILQTAQHLRELREVREEMRRSMAEVVTSMRAVALFFAPLITSVAARVQGVLSEKTAALEFFGTAGISPPEFLLILGVYVIILTVILVNYVVEIELGDDGLAKRMAVAGALPVAMVVFTAGTILGGQLIDFLLG